ncbi:MAG: hypothetical protein ACYCWW_16525 [Deltaproteobacteria bacterium]
MNPLLRLALLLAAVIAVGGYGVHAYVQEKTAAEARDDLMRIERTFDERVPAARELASAQDYGDEMRGLLKWYFSAIRDHDNRYPDFKDHDKGWEDIARKGKSGKIKGPELEGFKANHDAVEEVYQALSKSGYDPVLSASSAGMHFDLWRLEKQSHDGKPMLRLDFAWWGPQRKEEVDTSTGGAVRRTLVNATIQSTDITLLDDKGKLYGEMHGGEPNDKIVEPDRYVDLFPSNVVIGTYWLDLFPHEAQKMNLKITGVTRTVQGHELVGSYAWDVPLKDDWKLGEGQRWEGASTETREQDEIDGKQAAATDDDAPAKKKHHRH